MEIKINTEAIEAAINASASKSIESAMGGYQAQQAIAAIVTESFSSEVLRDSITKALAQVDREKITTALAEQLQKKAISATVLLLESTFAEMLTQLDCRGYVSEAERKTKKDAILAKLRVRE